MLLAVLFCKTAVGRYISCQRFHRPEEKDPGTGTITFAKAVSAAAGATDLSGSGFLRQLGSFPCCTSASCASISQGFLSQLVFSSLEVFRGDAPGTCGSDPLKVRLLWRRSYQCLQLWISSFRCGGCNCRAEFCHRFHLLQRCEVQRRWGFYLA